MPDISEQVPTELVDFTGVTSLPKNIEITERLIYGKIAFGRYRHRHHDGTQIGTIQYAVIINEGPPFNLEWRHAGSTEIQHTRIDTGCIQIHPSDRLVYKRWSHPSRMLFFAVDAEFIRRIQDDVFGGNGREITPQIGVRDEFITGLTVTWREELREHGAGGRMQAEASATLLVIHLLRTYAGASTDMEPVTGGMTDVRYHRVTQYIEDHLAEDMSLLTLARVAEMSVHHFKEAFKAKKGQPPHQYLNERRVIHAKEMLSGTDMPIVQIALAVGFSGQSHLTMNFRKLTKTTPLQYRLASRLGRVSRTDPT